MHRKNIREYSYLLSLFVLLLLYSCASSKKTSTTKSPVERWISQQNQEYIRLVKKSPEDFKTIGIGVKSSYTDAFTEAKFNSTVLLPEKVGMIIQTIILGMDGENNVSHQGGASIRVNNIRHEQIGQFNYRGKTYVCVVSSVNKAEYLNDLETFSTLDKIGSETLSAYKNKVLRHTSSSKQTTLKLDEEVQKWVDKSELSYNKWLKKNNDLLSANAWAADKNPDIAIRKAKLIAGSLLPEKVDLYVEIVTQSLIKFGVSQHEITETRIKSLSKSKLKISNISLSKNGKLKHKGLYYASVIVSKPKNDINSLIHQTIKNKSQLPTDFFEEAGNELNKYY